MVTNYAIGLNWIHHRRRRHALELWSSIFVVNGLLTFCCRQVARNNNKISIDWKCELSVNECVCRARITMQSKITPQCLLLKHYCRCIASTHFSRRSYFFRDINHFPSCDLTDFWICSSCASTDHRLCDHFEWKTKVREIATMTTN